MAISLVVKELKRRLREQGVSKLSVRRETAAKGYDCIIISHRDHSLFDQSEIKAVNTIMGRYTKGGNMSFRTTEVEMALGFREQKFVCSCGSIYDTKKEESNCVRTH